MKTDSPFTFDAWLAGLVPNDRVASRTGCLRWRLSRIRAAAVFPSPGEVLCFARVFHVTAEDVRTQLSDRIIQRATAFGRGGIVRRGGSTCWLPSVAEG